MTGLRSFISSRATRLWLAVVLLLSPASPLLLHAVAAPSQTLRAAAPADTPLLSGSQVQLEATSTAALPGGTLDMSARIRTPKPVDSLSARLQLFRPDGTLVYQRTQYAQGTIGKTTRFRWERSLSDLGVTPGRYPVVLTVTADQKGTVAERVIEKSLLVYNPLNAVVPVAFVVRVGATPMTDSSGRFVTDPGLETDARDTVAALAQAVLDTPDLRLTIGVPPVALREWKQVSEGYEAVAPDGTSSKVPATAAVPQEYAKMLEVLGQAIATQRLEMLGQPYTDPSLYALNDAELIGDVKPQYDVGTSAFFTALESTPSAGTAPYDWLLPPDAIKRIARTGVQYIVVDPVCVRTSHGRPTTGASRVRSAGTTVLVIDPPSNNAIASNETSAVVNRVFERQIGDQSKRPFVIGTTIERGDNATVASVLQAARALGKLPFTRITTAGDVASDVTGANASIVERRVDDRAPDGYWKAVAGSRSWARALTGALKEGEADAVAATSDTLMAEGSAWSGPNGSWELASRGLGFAKDGRAIAEGILGKISLKIENVTLPGSRGEVPVSVRNKSGRSLTVKLVAKGTDLVVTGERTKIVTLEPSENFVTFPVDLKSAIHGELAVEVVAEPRTLATQTVTVRASYLDRLAIIAGVVLVLFVLLIFIVRRVRAAEARDAEDARRRRERYTGTDDQHERDADEQ